MTAKNQNPVSHLGGKNAHPLIELFFEINHLKQVFRKGWLRKIPPENCESVAEHTFGTALLAWILADKFFPRLDQEKVLKLALIHDLGEIYAGDITPYDEVAPEEKNKRESEAVRKIFSSLPNGDQYITLWEEYENGSSPEATFVKQIDRLEMALQAAP
jgi:putative hydrolase of HD superfamily